MILQGTSAAGVAVNLKSEFDGAELDLSNLISGGGAMGYSVKVRVVMVDRAGASGKVAGFVHELVVGWTGSALTLHQNVPVIPDATGANGTGWTLSLNAIGTVLRVSCTGDGATAFVDCAATVEWCEVGA